MWGVGGIVRWTVAAAASISGRVIIASKIG